MKWLRLYFEVRRDPKVQKLRPELFKVWINLLCLAGETMEGGSLPSDDDLPYVMGMRKDVLRRFTDELEASKLLLRDVKGRLKPNGWDDRQRDSDDAAKRKRLSRSKTYVESSEPNVTGQKSDCHTDVPPRARGDLELEKEKHTPLPPSRGDVCVTKVIPEKTSDVPKPFVPSSDEEPEEPFIPPGNSPCLPGVVVRNPPAEVNRVVSKAERLFPMLEFGRKVQDVSGDWPIGWIDIALENTHARGLKTWSYVLGILRRFREDGGPKDASGPGKGPGTIRASPPADPDLQVVKLSPDEVAKIQAGYKPQPPKKQSR